jgi:predicted dienelactone hydrolase
MKYLYGFLVLAILGPANAETIYDQSRDRQIPLEISYPGDPTACTPVTLCPVTFVSAGYGVPHTAYSFLVRQLYGLVIWSWL